MSVNAVTVAATTVSSAGLRSASTYTHTQWKKNISMSSVLQEKKFGDFLFLVFFSFIFVLMTSTPWPSGNKKTTHQISLHKPKTF